MSLERVKIALLQLGLSTKEAEIFIYLTKKGPQQVNGLAKVLHYTIENLQVSLKSLQTKGLVFGETYFFALPFEEALSLLIQVEKEQTKTLETNKKELNKLAKIRNQKSES